MSPPARGAPGRRKPGAAAILTLAISVALAIGVVPGPRIARAQARRDVDRYDATFRKYTKRYFGVGHDWRIFKAQAMAESEMNPEARSWVGARGLMQLMPSTYKEIRSRNRSFGAIDDPEWNIAAGILHSRGLWRLWERDSIDADRREFMWGSYNAGQGTIRSAQRAARACALDPRSWNDIETIAPQVTRWRHRETLGYVRKIRIGLASMDEKGRIRRDRSGRPGK